MVKCMKKCRRTAKVAVMEVTQVVGVKTRARTLGLAAEAGVNRNRKATRLEDGELQMAYLKLRSRSLYLMNHPDQSRLSRLSDGRIFGNGERIISRCSSSASCEAVDENFDVFFPSVRADHKQCENVVGSSMCKFEDSGDRCETSLSFCSGELESSAKRKSRQSSALGFRTPPAAEIEEFFTAAEKSEKHRFSTRYNFDVDNEVPFEGRYEWVRINQ